MSLEVIQNRLEWVLMVAVVFGAGAIAQAQDQDRQSEGRIVRIGPANSQDAESADLNDDESADASSEDGGPAREFAPSRYWIGIMTGPVPPELRAHLDIPKDQGVLVREVFPDGPAAKASLKSFDVLLRANDVDLSDTRELMEAVHAAGEQQEQLTLEFLRHGKRETVWLTPTERPKQLGSRAGAPRDDRFGRRDFGGLSRPFEFRMFGPGAIGRPQAPGLAGIPGGVSVRVEKHNDEPAKVTVQRGEETWEIVGDDPESLQQLPDDLRPFVEQLLSGSSGVQPMPEFVVPQVPAMPIPHGAPRMFDHESLRQQLDAMERQLQEFQRQLDERLRGQFGEQEDVPE